MRPCRGCCVAHVTTMRQNRKLPGFLSRDRPDSRRIFAGVDSLSREPGLIASMNIQVTTHPVDGARVQRTWSRLAPVYDLVYGAMLQPGRRRALARMVLGPSDRVLEVGVG